MNFASENIKEACQVQSEIMKKHRELWDAASPNTAEYERYRNIYMGNVRRLTELSTLYTTVRLHEIWKENQNV